MRFHRATIAIAAMLLISVSAASADAPAASDEQLYANTITGLRGDITTELLDRHGIAVFRIWGSKAKAEGRGSPADRG